jgi:Flp pilus assembly protein TadG
MRVLKRRHSFARDEGGTAMVEFSIVAAFIFIPVVFGIIEFGRVVWAKNMVTAAAREGVRYAIVHGTDSGSPFDSAAIANYVQDRTKLSPLKISSAWTGKAPQDTVTVTVKYDYTPVVSIRGLGAKTVTGVSKQIISN